MPEPMPTGTRRIELFVREGLPEATREHAHTLATALQDLADDGHIASASVATLPKRSPIGGEGENQQYVSFREWAHEADVMLSPFFDTRECYCSAISGWRTYRIAPAICMAVYEDETLAAVYPHRDEQTHSIIDGIERLRPTEETVTPSNTPKPSLAD